MDDAEELDEPGYGFEPYDQEGASLLGGDGPEPATTASSPRDTVAAPPLALYRRYRPDTFVDVIGQEHVTEPLMRALTNNRVNHAYLFSGPRGCGKTTSARILARALNCEQGPRPDPCGQCRSCQDLARGGPGSIDVIEIDAASHGGVDDARDLRERAFFAPVHSRYKIYIVDEAHMVTTAGFNALLKLVEEPPPHVKFVFATTEPEKVIGTIRSRTHHYPFRLVPPKVLQAYLGQLCDREGIAVEQTVLPLVVRAGQGSVRDSLSVLDQLLGGAADSGVSYAQAAALLGYTPESLLDEILDAFAAGDAKGVFQAVDKVIEVGQDPRRFGEDLLRRLRDLVIVAAVPDALASGLVEAADDQGERLASQAAAMGAGELTRAAEVIAQGLTDMRGTTAPRLHLELMCSRVLLPGADVDERGVHARLDRLERRFGMVASDGPQAATAAPTSTPLVAPEEARPEPTPPSAERSETAAPSAERSESAASSAERSEIAVRSDQPTVHPTSPGSPAPTGASGDAERPAAAEAGSSQPESPQPTEPQPAAGLTTADVRRLWPDVLEEVKGRRRFTWVLISQNAQVHDVTDGVLTLAMKNAGARDGFGKGGSEDVVRDAVVQVLGVDLKISTLVDGGAATQRPPASTRPTPAPRPARQEPPDQAGLAAPPPVTPAPQSDITPAPQSDITPAGGSAGRPVADSHWREPDPEPDEEGRPDDAHLARPGGPPAAAAAPATSAVSSPSPNSATMSAKAREGIRPTRSGPRTTDQAVGDDYDEADFVEVPADDAESTGELLARHLGAELIGEENSAT